MTEISEKMIAAALVAAVKEEWPDAATILKLGSGVSIYRVFDRKGVRVLDYHFEISITDLTHTTFDIGRLLYPAAAPLDAPDTIVPETPAQARLLRLWGDRPIADLGLPGRPRNCLKNDNIERIAEVIILSDAEILRIPNMGRHSLKEIRQAIQKGPQ